MRQESMGSSVRRHVTAVIFPKVLEVVDSKLLAKVHISGSARLVNWLWYNGAMGWYGYIHETYNLDLHSTWMYG